MNTIKFQLILFLSRTNIHFILTTGNYRCRPGYSCRDPLVRIGPNERARTLKKEKLCLKLKRDPNEVSKIDGLLVRLYYVGPERHMTSDNDKIGDTMLFMKIDLCIVSSRTTLLTRLIIAEGKAHGAFLAALKGITAAGALLDISLSGAYSLLVEKGSGHALLQYLLGAKVLYFDPYSLHLQTESEHS